MPLGEGAAGGEAGNAQTRATFAAEAAIIAAGQARLTWLAPSRDETTSGAVLLEEEAEIWTGSSDERGLIVLMTTGTVITVSPSPLMMAA
jgi:hypothetical protein